ncbi:MULTISPECIES: TRAP transporter large permease [Rhodobacterales]|jgi:tripartite ATP-independent transporter DctM subunit|uniref:TRAP transporter large permease n=1 Tax=Rhodobacterales TaxID=204455 RepID=UPI00237F0E61|nr:TRAP transporter large permease [Phaeobacter gallaeciensis]MDE4141042.1 TRAP transporter large permease [Phaeobacter gallaeciensis]MDE4149487.1 TRAP transporter large permease [Phaeobacter gallaeciensis]MDE4154063.1 TRAP transporter large permease [Phaeobacter gallaeciensis]MDE4229455.1 TRAP transporter large permease [Phaeobacter gallaeciensis]MDE4258177.1 TRAP transporter large permease [Phaeobacter gallaeciensis]
MEWFESLALLLGSILVLMAIGMPVALAFLAANIVGAWFFMGGAKGITLLLNNGFGGLTNYALVPIPLFLLMGEVFFHTGLGARMFNAIDRLLGKLPGRLSYVTVLGGTAFSTLSGSSMGSTALLGSLMVPEMTSRGYKKHMSIGPILGTGGLAIIIPPSALAVLLATLARIDVGALLIAGILPGLVLASLYIGVIYLQTRIDPTAAPAYEVETLTFGEKARLLFGDVLPMLSVMVLIVIGMVGGLITPSEAAAFGALGVLILAILFRCLSWEAMKKSVVGALRVTLMAYLIVFGSATFSQLLAFSGASSGLIRWATSFDLAPVAMLLVMFCVLLLLGMFMEQISMMLLTVPIFFPLAASLGFDPIWFGLIILLALEISFTTPPFGLLLFVMKGVAPKDTTMRDIYMSAFPYMACSMLLVALLILFPQLALWLPGL